MPAPPRTSREEIVAAARAILEEDGPDAVAMTRVAERVGVRGPSLYKHLPDRSALVRAVADAGAADLGATLEAAMSTHDPAADLRALARAYRAFVPANPNGYALLISPSTPDRAADPVAVAELGRPIVAAVGRLLDD